MGGLISKINSYLLFFFQKAPKESIKDVNSARNTNIPPKPSSSPPPLPGTLTTDQQWQLFRHILLKRDFKSTTNIDELVKKPLIVRPRADPTDPSIPPPTHSTQGAEQTNLSPEELTQKELKERELDRQILPVWSDQGGVPILFREMQSVGKLERPFRGRVLSALIIDTPTVYGHQCTLLDANGDTFPIFFYVPDPRPHFSYRHLIPGHQVLVRDPKLHLFMDGQLGVRIEEADAPNVRVVQIEHNPQHRLRLVRQLKDVAVAQWKAARVARDAGPSHPFAQDPRPPSLPPSSQDSDPDNDADDEPAPSTPHTPHRATTAPGTGQPVEADTGRSTHDVIKAVNQLQTERLGHEKAFREKIERAYQYTDQGLGQLRRLVSYRVPTEDPDQLDRIVAVELTDGEVQEALQLGQALLCNAVLIALDVGDISRAHGYVRDALAFDPANPKVHYRLSQIFEAEYRLEDAIKEAEVAFRLYERQYGKTDPGTQSRIIMLKKKKSEIEKKESEKLKKLLES